ncbi:MAG: Regulator of RpoS [Holosporales bacterium]
MILTNAFYDACILVVDDDFLNLKILTIYLEKAGYRNIKTARNGQEALDEVKIQKPDIIILDILMPVMDGYDVIRYLRAQYPVQDLPIIVETGVDDVQEKQKAWELGATDLLNKPIHKLELLSRIHLHLTQHSLFKELFDYKKKADDDVKDALALQKSLLPSYKDVAFIEQKYNVNLDYIFRPCRFLSGDLFGITPLDDDSFSLWICDFSGKGIKAALNTFRFHTLLKGYSLDLKSPKKVLKSINQTLKELLTVGTFSTCCYGVVNVKEKTFTYSVASQPPLIHYDRTQKTHQLLECKSLPLGIEMHTEYEEYTLCLEDEKNLILYSDALFETDEDLGFSFEEENLALFFNQLGGKNVVPWIKMMMDTLDNDDFSFADDLTIIELSLKGKCL